MNDTMIPNRDIIVDLFKSMQVRVHHNAINMGWWAARDQAVDILKSHGLESLAINLIKSQCILLEHCELSEGVEGMRKDLKDDHLPEFPMEVVEQADAFIRMLDLAEKYNWPLAEAILAKMAYNEGRPHMHGGKAF